MFVSFQRECHAKVAEHKNAGWVVYIVPINWKKVAVVVVVVVQDETMSAGYYVKAYTKQKGSPHGFLVVHDFEWEEGGSNRVEQALFSFFVQDDTAHRL